MQLFLLAPILCAAYAWGGKAVGWSVGILGVIGTCFMQGYNAWHYDYVADTWGITTTQT